MQFTGGGFAGMAQPSVRAKAMIDQNQQRVWDEVRRSSAAIGGAIGAPVAVPATGATSYARVMSSAPVQEKVASVANPVVRSYERVIGELKQRNAVGVVVAVGGQIIWADVFASTSLLQRYWPKLARSYATEALVTRAAGGSVTPAEAEKFLASIGGTHEVIDVQPGLYRHTEITGQGFMAFELTSLLPNTGFDLHLAKMAEER
jgi:hypothetical protein